MTDISFDCPECGGNLKVDASGAGLTVPCPLCAKQITIPSPPATNSHTSETVSCPFCGEQILFTAIKCKHCGEFLDGREKPRQANYPQQLNIPTVQDPRRAKPQAIELTPKKYKAQGCLAVITICAGIVIVMIGSETKNDSGVAIGSLMFLFGLIWWVGARIMAWWERG